MTKRITALLLVLCMCATLLAGCGTEDSATGSPTTTTPPVTEDNNPPEHEASNILGILYDMTSSYDFESPEVLTAVCEPLGLDYTQFDSYITRGVAVDSLATAMEELTAAGCSVIIFTDKFTSDLAGSFADKYPETEVLVSVYEPVVEPIILSSHPINYVYTSFSKDRAWVKFNGDQYGLIDENGYLLYSIAESELREQGLWYTAMGDNVGFTEFDNERTVVFPGRHVGKAMLILDKDGKVIFDGQGKGDGYSYAHVAEGNGISLAIEFVKNFSTNASYCCEIDASGDITSRTEIAGDLLDLFSRDVVYFGEGIFATDTEVVYNSVTHNAFKLGAAKWDIIAVDEQYVFLKGAALADGSLYKVPISALDSKDVWDSFDIASTQILSNFYGGAIAGGIINTESGLYDYNGNLIAAYPKEWKILDLKAFDGDYAVAVLEGADRKEYFVAVDRNGNVPYDPVRHDAIISIWKGYVLFNVDGQTKSVDPSGEEITVEEYWLMLAAEKTGESGVVWANYENSYGNMGNSFFDKDGNILDAVHIVGNYDEIAGAGSQTTPQKEYQFPSSYSIEGKWKNIGTYTFGQVGSGAIVAFEGTKCNFYSPADTYAFYAEGAEYKLDCTSLLGETLTFTVKIVDENHIDIVNGSNILELQRVG